MEFLSKTTKPFSSFSGFFSYLTDELGTLFYDTFTDTNATALTDHTPDIDLVGSGWVDGLSSNIDIQSNTANLLANSIYYAEVGKSNVRVTCDIIKDAFTGLQGIQFRYSNAGNTWKAERDNSPAQIQIVERVGSVDTVRAFSSLANGVGGTFNFVAEASGQTITLDVTGATTISLSYGSATNFINQTKCGINGTLSAGTQRWDNFLVESIS